MIREHRPAEKHIAFQMHNFMASLHSSDRAMITFIQNQRLSPFNDCGNLCGTFFRVTLPLLEPSLDCSKAVYFATIL